MCWDECVNGIPLDVIDEYYEVLEKEKSLSSKYFHSSDNQYELEVHYHIISNEKVFKVLYSTQVGADLEDEDD